jgi:hypothetical protein
VEGLGASTLADGLSLRYDDTKGQAIGLFVHNLYDPMNQWYQSGDQAFVTNKSHQSLAVSNRKEQTKLTAQAAS